MRFYHFSCGHNLAAQGEVGVRAAGARLLLEGEGFTHPQQAQCTGCSGQPRASVQQ